MEHLRMPMDNLFTFDGEVLEHFELGRGSSQRFHVAGIRRFEWATDKKGRYVLAAESLLSTPLLTAVMPPFPVTDELAASAEAFAEKVRGASERHRR